MVKVFVPNKNTSKNNDFNLSVNNEKNTNDTTWNSHYDNQLKTIGPLDNLVHTINNQYKFSNSMNLKNVTDAMRGGLTGIGKIRDFLKAANKAKNALRNGNIMDAIGNIAPEAKYIMGKAGLDPSVFDKFTQVAQIGVKIGNTYKGIKNGNIDVLAGINDIAKSITGHDIALLQDVQAFRTTVTAIIEEFSSTGIAIKGEWRNLINDDRIGFNGASEIASTLLPNMAKYGDYETILIALETAAPQKINKINEDVINKLLEDFRRDSVFNASRTDDQIFDLVMNVVYQLNNNNILWVERKDTDNAFNMNLFNGASRDFKQMAKSVLSKRFTLNQDQENQEQNEVMILMSDLFQMNDFRTELQRDYPGFVTNTTEYVSDLVTPNVFKLHNYTSLNR